MSAHLPFPLFAFFYERRFADFFKFPGRARRWPRAPTSVRFWRRRLFPRSGTFTFAPDEQTRRWLFSPHCLIGSQNSRACRAGALPPARPGRRAAHGMVAGGLRRRAGTPQCSAAICTRRPNIWCFGTGCRRSGSAACVEGLAWVWRAVPCPVHRTCSRLPKAPPPQLATLRRYPSWTCCRMLQGPPR